MTHIEFTFDTILLKGVILERKAFFIKVQLLSPFEAWDNYYMISGRCRGTPNHFLTEYGDKSARDLLIISYLKFKEIQESFDRLCNFYSILQMELKALNKISDIEIKTKIKSKFENWFFDKVFISGASGIVVTYHDRNYILEIFENHLNQEAHKKKWNRYRK
ncbi:hypothetical protein [Psychroserpens jangbogonensis]|uniref:hypothetical protein n=1 Tax=Psychroserpens jangbogonensis TaxID=1484460 RepID=UPI00053D57C0|nr:hypothetical protein [Psychroserpens jangbogonensis]